MGAVRAVQRADQDAALAPVGLDEVLDQPVVHRANAVEAQIHALLGEAAEKRRESLGVIVARRPEPQRRAVAKDDVDRPAVGSC
jgi:hypothetical protein